jgi:hypothetical protein
MPNDIGDDSQIKMMNGIMQQAEIMRVICVAVTRYPLPLAVSVLNLRYSPVGPLCAQCARNRPFWRQHLADSYSMLYKT